MSVPITDDRIRRWEHIYQQCVKGASSPIADLWDIIVDDFRHRPPVEQEEILALVHVPELKTFLTNVRSHADIWSSSGGRVENPPLSIPTKKLDPALSSPQSSGAGTDAGVGGVRPVKM